MGRVHDAAQGVNEDTYAYETPQQMKGVSIYMSVSKLN